MIRKAHRATRQLGLSDLASANKVDFVTNNTAN